MKSGLGPKIREMMDEAENERMHLMIFIDIAKPSWLERYIVLFAQFIFIIFYLLLYIFFPKTAHRMTHYFEEEAVKSYTQYLHMVESGQTENVDAPQIAIDYYKLKKSAKLTDVIKKVRADEEKHSQVNKRYSE
jgi:ubiquinol oxidase